LSLVTFNPGDLDVRTRIRASQQTQNPGQKPGQQSGQQPGQQQGGTPISRARAVARPHMNYKREQEGPAKGGIFFGLSSSVDPGFDPGSYGGPSPLR
jgi:hypothetical protein